MAPNLYLKPEEGKFLSMAVVSLIEQVRESNKNQRINWNPEAIKMFKEMTKAGASLKIKLEKLGFEMSELPPFIDGDEKEFLTKES